MKNIPGLNLRRTVILTVALLTFAALAIIMNPAIADTRQSKPDAITGTAQPSLEYGEMHMVKMLYADTIVRDYRLVNFGDQVWCDVRILHDTDEGPAIESHILTTSDPMVHDLLFYAYINGLKIIVKAHGLQAAPDRNDPPFDAPYYEIDQITIEKSQ